MIKSFLLQNFLIFVVMIRLTWEQKFSKQIRDDVKEKLINKRFQERLVIHEKIMREKPSKIREYSKAVEDYANIIKEKIMDRSVDYLKAKENKIVHSGTRNQFSFTETESKKMDRTFPLKDRPERFFGNKTFDPNINNLPLNGRAKKSSWSGTYWAMRNGITSVRYNANSKNTIGPVNPVTGEVTENYSFMTSVNMYQQPAEYNSIMQTNRGTIEKYVDDNFSPSEKYDLLVGDYQFTLTNQQKNEGKKYYQEYGGDIPGWFGICHGWAPAAYYFDEPILPVNATSLNGIKIKFLPDDIKGLASLYLANANTFTNFAGDVCRVFKPNIPVSDSETKLWLDPRCHTINPGTMLIILGNHMGKERKNMVFDPEADPEIWNQPVNAYEMRYFNLITNEFSSDPQQVKIPVRFIRKSKDKFLNFLGRQADRDAEFVVGVYVNVTYAVETNPYHNDVAWPDVNKTVESIAAIELDKDDNIVGGEWKYNTHPNFFWKFDEDHPVTGCCDKNAPKFNGRTTEEMTNWAAMASSKGQVIRSVVDYLVKESSKKINIPDEQRIRNRWEFLFRS